MAGLDDLYARNPGTVTAQPAAKALVGSVTPTTATASQASSQGASAPSSLDVTNASASKALTSPDSKASSTGYSASQRSVGADELVQNQLTKITSQDSPLMQRARSEGMLTAARRGLQNSSIAAGAAQGAMVDRAIPVAQQDAATYLQTGLSNQEAENRAREFGAGAENTAALSNAQSANDIAKLNAQLETAVSQGNAEAANAIRTRLAELQTQTSQFNAEQANEVSKLNAQLQTATAEGNRDAVNAINARLAELTTQTNQFNAGLTQEANMRNAEAENQMRTQVLQANAELNKQYLAGTQAMDLATIQGTYQQLISSNETASNLYRSYFDSISQVMANKDMPPDRVAQMVNVQQSMLEAGLRMMDKMNGLNLGEFELPGASGTSSSITPTPGSGVTGGTTQPTPQPTPYVPPSYPGYPIPGYYYDPYTGSYIPR